MSRLSSRIAAGALVLFGVVFLGLGLFIDSSIEQQRYDDARANLELEALLLAEIARDDTLDVALENVSLRPDRRVTLLDEGGVVLMDTRTDPGDQFDLSTQPDVVEAITGEAGEHEGTNPLDNREEFSVAVPIESDGNVIRIVRVGVPSDDLAGNVGPLFVSFLGAGLVLLAATVLVARHISAQVTELSVRAGRLLDDDEPERRDHGGSEEFRDLEAAIDHLAAGLRASIRSTESRRVRLEAILEHLADGILIIDRQGSVVLANQAIERLLGIDRHRALDRSYGEVIRDHELVELIRSARTFDSRDTSPPTRFIDLGRPRRSIQAFAYPMTDEQEELVVVILRDITELRRTEVVRRDFVANVSHELRTPVASLKALVETLLDGALEDDEVARDFLQRMDVEVDDLARLVAELLELSRAESRRLQLHLEEGDLARVIERAITRLQTQSESASIALLADIESQLPTTVFDTERIEHVLINLLQNAIRFSPSGSTVTVRAEHRNGSIRISVEDEGPGIPDEELERVFERFYRTDRARAKSGSGLGLAIAKHLVQAHGGEIWAEHGRDGGAVFRFTLPVSERSSDSGFANPVN